MSQHRGLGRMTISVKIRGIEALTKGLQGADLSHAIGVGLKAGATVVEADAKVRVHSPDHPFIGKAGRNVATGRLQASIGTSDLRGSGLDQSIAIGPPYGKAGTGTFGRSKAPSRISKAGRKIGNLTGGHRNKGNVRIYGPIEEARHPFLEPSVSANVDRIKTAITIGIERVLSRIGR